MRKSIAGFGLVFIFTVSGCSGWTVQPTPFFPATPIPSHTPLILSPTPNIVLAPTIFTVTRTLATTPPSNTQPSETVTLTPEWTSTVTITPPVTSTIIPLAEELQVNILGCNTSLDITHGMGEVTNAFVEISNLGSSDLINVCATLRGLDEGAPHPDKTRCLTLLPARNLVTFKLTVDTTFEQDTPIQIDVSADQIPLQRIPKSSCTDIGLFLPNVGQLNVAKPIP